MREHVTRTMLIILLAAMLPFTVLTMAVSAQEPEAGAALTSADVDDEELERFTRALSAVLEIQQRLEGEVASASTPAEEQSSRETANAEMVQVIQDNELEVERFNQITSSVNEDVELNERYQAMRQELAEEGAEN